MKQGKLWPGDSGMMAAVACVLVICGGAGRVCGSTVQPQCAQYCVYHSCQLLGVPVSMGQICELMAPKDCGESMKEIRDILRRLGLECEGKRLDFEGLLRERFPVIVHMVNQAEDGRVSPHFLVVERADPCSVRILDGLGRRGRAWQSRLRAALLRPIAPIVSARAVLIGSILVVIIGVTTPVLALNKPAKATTRYEVLEPETWVGKELPILKYIDIGEQLQTGSWLVVLYHSGCRDCIRAIGSCLRSAYELEAKGSRNGLGVSMIAVPPHQECLIGRGATCMLGRLCSTKIWLVSTPVVLLLTEGRVKDVCSGRGLDWARILSEVQPPSHLCKCGHTPVRPIY